MPNTKCFFALLLGLGISIPPASAQTMITYSSGTGFFVSRGGYVLTNLHVISPCNSPPEVEGAVPKSPAKVVARDKEHDLALLKTDVHPNDEAHLSTVKQPLRVGDPVLIVGYPGTAWKSGKTHTSEANILKTNGPKDEAEWLEFSDSLGKGNSGGPLLDSSGNVVGVVAAKGRLVRRGDNTDPEETIEQFDLAISLPVIRGFLEANAVSFSEADSGIYLSSSHSTEIAQNFIVNVRCEISRE